ncbi:hypothetical protein IC762_03815 [Bradyrhizobium genosp. L]|uniref:hypothetical protein n=1 Tax=Bradyrhizobium genosp. L TaxID=83637 RepID=UPI0018A295E2|nr:hypothetical protein [Bradyrhizobium genosp. L]QPF85469.1 hypothetical protein IC762_03815 [Bradyrhizobium genosp. L]
MFEKLAKFWPFERLRLAPPTAIHCNDNQPGVRRRRRPAPVCHWILVRGRLECRWTFDDPTGDRDHQRRAA